VAFGSPLATSTFGGGIEFLQPATLPGGLRRVELLLEYPGGSGPQVRVVDPGGSGSVNLRYFLDTAGGELLPNTRLTGRWRVTGDDGSAILGPAVSARYDDTRFTWQTREGPIVRVHWYEGGTAFGTRALEIGTTAIEKAGRLLGVTETEPVDFLIYASQQAFYAALGPGTRENVGGQANAGIRTLFALITPSEINAAWVSIVIPHELTHLVFDTAVSNPYHIPPRWLNEGLAVYLAQGYGSTDRAAVERAARDGSLMPLGALVDEFPTTRDRFVLAYAESVSAVDYLVRTNGEPALVSLIRSYVRGVTDNEAFGAALGVDTTAFDTDWRANLKAREPVAYGPQPAPAGPLPGDWASAGSGGSGALASPNPSSGGGAAGPEAGGSADVGTALPLAIAVALALALGLSLVWIASRAARRPPAAGPDT